MSHTQGQGSSFDRRPLVSDAPDWFNRARVRANQRLVFQPRPVPLPAITFAPGNPAARWWLRHKGICLRALPLVALPVVFAIGYWTRGAVAPRVGETASVGKSEAAPLRPSNLDEERIRAVASRLLAERAATGNVPTRIEIAAHDDAQPALVQALPNREGSGSGIQTGMGPPPRGPSEPALAHNRIQPRFGQQAAHSSPFPAAAPAATPAVTPVAEPADGFSLKTAGIVKQVSAEVIRPAAAWFETTAEQGAACTTGTCPAPVARLDRKLNTALEWAPSPEAAGEMAARDGKLVFLIHVSGNFAQPGFT